MAEPLFTQLDPNPFQSSLSRATWANQRRHDEPTQLALVSAGIAALIIADSAPVGQRLLDAAEARGVTVIATAADAFGVANLIHLTLPAERIMSTDVPRVRMQDTIEYVQQVVSNAKYRAACV